MGSHTHRENVKAARRHSASRISSSMRVMSSPWVVIDLRAAEGRFGYGSKWRSKPRWRISRARCRTKGENGAKEIDTG